MGILSRFADIIKANINELLDKAEDPSKMINQYLIDAKQDLAEVKRETASVMAEETKARRALDEAQAEADKLTGYAKKALLAGNEGDAKIFVSKKQDLESQIKSLELAYETAKANADKMKQLHDKLTNDIKELESKKSAIEAKVSIAKTQQTLNKFSGASDKLDETMGAFKRMEEKADKMLDEAAAMAELNTKPVDEAENLEQKYAADDTPSVNDELEALKKELGLAEE